jgi:hypothetical protein
MRMAMLAVQATMIQHPAFVKVQTLINLQVLFQIMVQVVYLERQALLNLLY